MNAIPETRPANVSLEDWQIFKKVCAKFSQTPEERAEEKEIERRRILWDEEEERNNALDDDGLKSREELFEILKELKKTYPGLRLPKTAEELSDEIFGRLAMIFLSCGNMGERRALEDELEKRGVPVYRAYCCREGNCQTDSPHLEVRVKYFKGWHWDE